MVEGVVVVRRDRGTGVEPVKVPDPETGGGRHVSLVTRRTCGRGVLLSPVESSSWSHWCPRGDRGGESPTPEGRTISADPGRYHPRPERGRRWCQCRPGFYVVVLFAVGSNHNDVGVRRVRIVTVCCCLRCRVISRA